MKISLVCLTAAALCACGPQSVVTDGTYATNSTDPLPNATLLLDVKAKTASVTPSGASTPVVLQMTALSAAQWERGCPTNLSSVSVETWTLAPDPAVLGSLSLSGARLLAGCGLDKGDPDSVVIKGTGEPNASTYQLSFQRR